MLHANAELSTELIEADASEVSRALLQRFSALAGDVIATPQHQAAHRWRYARPSSPLEVSFIQDGTLLAAGDWCGGDSAGAAVRSGRAAAAALLS